MVVLRNLFCLFLTIGLCTSCGDSPFAEEDYTELDRETDDTDSSRITVGKYEIYDVDTEEKAVTLNYTLNLSEKSNVYFVFTNVSATGKQRPYVVTESQYALRFNEENISASSNERFLGKSGSKFITEQNEKIANDVANNFYKRSVSNTSNSKILKSYSQGDTANFKYAVGNSFSTAACTCRKVVTVGDVSVNIWVANDDWNTSGAEVTSTHVDNIANKFLKTGTDNDIYDWDTSIAGAPWGEHDYPGNFISKDTKDINIVVVDIDDDGSSAILTGYVGGYFYSGDCFFKSQVSSSNEGLFFYVDSYGTTFADKTLQTTYSTLAHEFQHMIHFYQKTVCQGVDTSTWFNEMCSVAIEDFVGGKLGLTSTAYDSRFTTDNIPQLPTSHFLSWGNDLASYVSVYCFGAYLSRNFGGVQLFNKMIANSDKDGAAIVAAIEKQTENTYTFEQVLKNWGVSQLLSDLKTTTVPYKNNNGSTFSSTLNSITYTYKSLNYHEKSLKIYDVDAEKSNLYGGQSAIMKEESITGSNTWKFNIPSTVRLTVVKEVLN